MQYGILFTVNIQYPNGILNTNNSDASMRSLSTINPSTNKPSTNFLTFHFFFCFKIYQRKVHFTQNGEGGGKGIGISPLTSPHTPDHGHGYGHSPGGHGSIIGGESIMSTPSSVASGMSYRRKGHGRSKRGKSKIVATYDMYKQVLETEGMYHIDDERTLGLRPGQVQRGENESALMMKGGDDVDDLRPEDAADAVSRVQFEIYI